MTKKVTKPTATTTGLIVTLRQAETVCRTIAARLRKAGHEATVVPSNTRVSVRVKGHKPGSIFGYVPGVTTQVSSPYFNRKLVAGSKLDIQFKAYRNYNIVSGALTPAQVEALLTTALTGTLLPTA